MIELIFISTGIALIMALTVFKFRMKETTKPVNAKKIILPPIFMSTGALMFLFPMFQITLAEFMESVTIGILFSFLLIKTSKFEIVGQEIYLQRSKAFIFILIGLLIIRLVAKILLGSTLQLGAISGMFFLLAYGMVVPWRVTMYFQYKKVKKELPSLA